MMDLLPLKLIIMVMSLVQMVNNVLFRNFKIIHLNNKSQMQQVYLKTCAKQYVCVTQIEISVNYNQSSSTDTAI